jgi:pyruvate/2-oxoglutarate dehydrogenase complex dihydrolipoamide acyltransferase (E2) component
MAPIGLWHNLSAAGGNRGFRDNFRTAFAEKGMLAIRSVVKVTLAGDHRATDGLIGSHFLAAINNYLQNLNHYERR